jgi:hypothetical protein
VKSVDISEPAGVIKLLRLIVPAGTRTSATGVIPDLAGVGISTPAPGNDASETCQRRGELVVCNQAEEACPMPMATWRFRLRKLSGRAGIITLEFVVGTPPAHRRRRSS